MRRVFHGVIRGQRFGHIATFPKRTRCRAEKRKKEGRGGNRRHRTGRNSSPATDAFTNRPWASRTRGSRGSRPPSTARLSKTYAGKPWSCWGESTFANGMYYASIGDHLAPAGSAYVYEYDPVKKEFRQLVDLKELLALPDGHYAPGKIHTQLTMGKDGYLYFGTHRGSTSVTTDEFHFKGDWIVRVPSTGKREIVAGPVPKALHPHGVP